MTEYALVPKYPDRPDACETCYVRHAYVMVHDEAVMHPNDPVVRKRIARGELAPNPYAATADIGPIFGVRPVVELGL